MSEDLLGIYTSIKPIIINRLNEFKNIWILRNELSMFKELVFCLLTPQSKAKTAWESVEEMFDSGVIFRGEEKDIQPYVKGVRFYKNKSHYIVRARNLFWRNGRFTLLRQINENEIMKTRDTIVHKVKGFGYKEASHFLRNIGLFENISILDRHIMRNMVEYGYLKELPASLSRKKYLEVEKVFFRFAEDSGIPPAHLDLLLWYKETGEVFK